MEKSPEAFRTISEVADWLDTPAHVLRFWESRFPEIAPVKRAGGRRYYRPEDMQLLGGIKHLLHTEGHTIKSVQERLKVGGPSAISVFSPPLSTGPAAAETLPEEDSAMAPVRNGNGHASDARIPAMAGAVADEPDWTAEEAAVERWVPAAADEAEDGDRPAPIHAPLPAADPPDLPPIGFFFDDSDDAAPAADQSGTFAAPLGESGPEMLADLSQPDEPPPPPAPPLALPPLPDLPDLPADAEDGAGLGAAPVSAAAGLRGLTRRDLPADWRRRLPEIIARLQRLGRGGR